MATAWLTRITISQFFKFVRLLASSRTFPFSTHSHSSLFAWPALTHPPDLEWVSLPQENLSEFSKLDEATLLYIFLQYWHYQFSCGP